MEINSNNIERENWDRYLSFLLGYFSVLLFFQIYTISLIILTTPNISIEFEIDFFIIGIIGGICSFGYLIGMMLSSLSDIYGRKKIIIIQGIFFSITAVLVGFSPNLLYLILLRFLNAIFTANIISMMFAEEVPARYRGRANGVLTALGMIGALLANIMYIFYQPIYNWRFLFIIVNLPGIVIVVLLGLFMKETKRFSSEKNKGKKFFRESYKKNLKELFQNKHRKNLIICIIGTFSISVMLNTIGFYYVYYLYIEKNWELVFISFVDIFVNLSFLFGFLFGGPLADKLGRKAVIKISTVLFIIGALFFVLISNMVFIIIGLIIISMCHAIILIVISLITAELHPTELRGTAVGFVGLTSSFGMIFIPLLMSFLWSINFNLGEIFLLFLIFPVIIFFVSFFIPETKGEILEDIISKK